MRDPYTDLILWLFFFLNPIFRDIFRLKIVQIHPIFSLVVDWEFSSNGDEEADSYVHH